jgi:undecaprenyl-diphosphatase
MQTLNAILLGLIQGLTEFLPVSSSGHLVLFQHFFQKSSAANDISLEVVLHFGTLLAVLVFFRNDIMDLLVSSFQWKRNLDFQRHSRNRMIIVYLLISTFCTGLIYLLFGKKMEAVFAKPLIVAMMLSITGLIVFLSDLVKKTEIPLSGMGIVRSIIIGLGQGIAMLPGISRSGTTIATALYCGVKRADAARYSFLLSIPAVLAANLSEFRIIVQLQTNMLISYLFGALAAFISGYLVIGILLRLIRACNLKYFAFYCWFISALSITLILNHL